MRTMGGTITITLPSASPELYLKGVRWGREAIDYATSAALPGRIPKKRRGADKVLDLLLYEWPELIERQAAAALERGDVELGPVLEVDKELLGLALERGESIWNSLLKTLRTGGPVVDEEIVDLRTRTRATTQQALAETG
jgi:hypothetical protein